MTEPRCDRPYRHHEHDYVDDGGTNRHCAGTKTTYVLPELFADRPALLGVGVVGQLTAMEVASA